jgi:hypothetical protein
MEICYTVSMNSDQHIWQSWVLALQRWGITGGMAALLETAGPLTIVAAQFVYFSQPFTRTFIQDAHLAALGRMLENPGHVTAFTALLREVDRSE